MTDGGLKRPGRGTSEEKLTGFWIKGSIEWSTVKNLSFKYFYGQTALTKDTAKRAILKTPTACDFKSGNSSPSQKRSTDFVKFMLMFRSALDQGQLVSTSSLARVTQTYVLSN